jgi:tetratricopeptide (TPR) repeat protein
MAIPMRADIDLPPFHPSAGHAVVILEAARGTVRRKLLERWTREAKCRGAAAAWTVRCDAGATGLWAGLNEWMEALVPALEQRAPELVVRHDAELVAVLPALRGRITPRHVPLTDVATRDEVVRNYSPERAFRTGHGIVDLLDEWHQRSGGGSWALACDDFDLRGALVGRFFRELVRRRGEKLRLHLLLAVAPGQAEAVAAELSGLAPVRVVSVDVEAEPVTSVSPEEAERRAVEMEGRLREDPSLVPAHVHEMPAIWTAAGYADRAAAWHLAAMRLYNQVGYHEDAMRHAEPVQAALGGPEASLPGGTRWNMVVALYTTYQACGQVERACEIVRREALGKLTRPEERARALYVMAMFHVRYLPEPDPAEGERCLYEALRELRRAEMPDEERHFMTVFVLNGLALVRVRQGRNAEAAELSRANHERLAMNLPPERHRLYRSVLLYNAAQVAARSGDQAEAIRCYTAALELDPHYSEYYNERGNAYLKSGMLAEAERDYRRAIEVAAPYPEVWFNLGQCLGTMRRPAEAEAAYARCLDLEPEHHRARVGRAQALAALGRRDEALAEYDAAIAADGSNPLVLANRAALRFSAGRVEEAVADLDRAISLSPRNSGLYRNRAVALKELGRADDEAADLETYLRLATDAKDREAIEARLGELSAVAVG